MIALVLRLLLALLLLGAGPTMLLAEIPAGAAYRCQPTPEDEMGPFYRPGAPLSSVIGHGYLLSGTVKSAVDCAPIDGPLIEFWQAAPNGRYEESHRAAIITGDDGVYRLETDAPAEYFTRPAHIHIRVSAEGFQTLVTQHYLAAGETAAQFDLVLVPK